MREGGSDGKLMLSVMGIAHTHTHTHTPPHTHT